MPFTMVGGDFVDVGEAFAALHAFGHRGLHGAGLDGDDVHAFAVDAIAHAVDERGQAGLGAAVDVVGFAAAIAGDGAEDGDGAGAALGAEVSEPSEQADGSGVVGVDDLRGVVEVALGLRLIAKYTERDKRDIESAECVDGVCEKVCVVLGAVEVGDGCIDEGGAACARVGGNGGEAIRIARDEEEAVAASGPEADAGFGDAGGRAEDEDAPGVRRGGLRCGFGVQQG